MNPPPSPKHLRLLWLKVVGVLLFASSLRVGFILVLSVAVGGNCNSAVKYSAQVKLRPDRCLESVQRNSTVGNRFREPYRNRGDRATGGVEAIGTVFSVHQDHSPSSCGGRVPGILGLAGVPESKHSPTMYWLSSTTTKSRRVRE